MLTLLGALLAWAIWGQLDIVAVAQGKLVPESFLKIVQPAEAGIVRQILVKEGETVREGQVLMRMDSVASEADGKTLELDRRRKAMTLRRLDAEIGEHEFSALSQDSAALFRELLAQFRANRTALESALGAERANLQKARQDLATAMQVSAKLSEILPHYRAQDEAFENLVKAATAKTPAPRPLLPVTEGPVNGESRWRSLASWGRPPPSRLRLVDRQSSVNAVPTFRRDHSRSNPSCRPANSGNDASLDRSIDGGVKLGSKPAPTV